jgi:hypothetical protein
VGGQTKVDPKEDKDEAMEFQNAKRVLKDIYDHSDSDSSTNKHRKVLHIMYGGSWDIMFRCVVKTLCRAVMAAARAPSATPHHKWMETSIGFDTFDCPKNMVGVRHLPLFVSPTITNIMMYNILVDGGATLNLISLTTFKQLLNLMLKLAPSRLFPGVGPGSIMLCGSISLLVTFGTPENYHMESVLFNVVEVNLPFNAILGRPTMYKFMDVAHYGYLVMKMSSSNGAIKIRGDCTASVFALEKV